MKRSFWIRANRQDLNATKVPTALDIAWAAGIFEGEGTVRLCGKTKRGLMASVVQKDTEILYRLRDWFGGSVRDNGAHIDCHTWDICGDRCRVFIALIHSRLTVRRKMQVEKARALEFLNGVSPDDLSIADLQGRLLALYEEKRKDTWYGPNKSAVRRANYQDRKKADPEYLGQLNEKNKKWRQKQAQSKVVSIA